MCNTTGGPLYSNSLVDIPFPENKRYNLFAPPKDKKYNLFESELSLLLLEDTVTVEDTDFLVCV